MKGYSPKFEEKRGRIQLLEELEVSDFSANLVKEKKALKRLKYWTGDFFFRDVSGGRRFFCFFFSRDQQSVKS
jgi:hypothetical protein